MIELTTAIAASIGFAVVALILGISVGVGMERRARHRLAAEAGRAALDELARRQAAADHETLTGRKPLPPMVAREEALARAAREGISVEEAAGAIFASRAAALVRDNVRVHRRSHL